MKIDTPVRVVPDERHQDIAALFSDDALFELSTIRPEDASLAMEMLIGNYSAPRDAVIRELVVNAIDSQRAAGVTRPVEVTVPTEDAPILVIRDHGLGLSRDDMVEVFTRPAASTKRGENISTGGLGIGAKAPFTVTDRFRVRGTQGGVTSTLVMARIDGQLMHLVQDTVETPDQADGVEIIVPVETAEITAWHRALSHVHFWWDRGLVTVTNPEDVRVALPSWQERFTADPGGWSTELPQVSAPRQLTTTTVLMGQIGYAVPENLVTLGLPVLFRLPVGAVNIAPNRESIVDDAHSAQLLNDLVAQWQRTTFDPAIEQLLDPATSLWTIARIERELADQHLVRHFRTYLRHAFETLVEQSLLPPRYMHHFWPHDDYALGTPFVTFGEPTKHAARGVGIGELMELMASPSNPEIVFVDVETLSDAKRKILTGWARTTKVIAVVVNRQWLKEHRFARQFGWSRECEYTRPFADADQLEWVDPADIQVVTAPRKEPEPVTEETPVRILRRAQGQKSSYPLGELADLISSSRNHWAVIDSQREFENLDTTVPQSVFTVASGQPAAKVLRDRLGTKVLTVAQYLQRRAEIAERSLTTAQRRWLADAHIAEVEGVRKYFRPDAAWIAETQDPDVRRIAEKIAHRVSVTRSVEKASSLRAGTRLIRSLDPLLRDEDWLLAHGSLGQYAPAVFAAASQELVRNTAKSSVQRIEFIRTVIATQILGSAPVHQNG